MGLYGNENGATGRVDLRAGNVAGAYISMQAIGQEVLRLVGQASIADGSTALMIRRNVGGSFSVQQVSMGAADSGGSGFKVLRVPN